MVNINKLQPDFIDRLSVDQGEVQGDQAKVADAQQGVQQAQGEVGSAQSDLRAAERETGITAQQAQEVVDNYGDNRSDLRDKISDTKDQRSELQDRLGNLAADYKGTLSTDEKAELSSLLGLQDRSDWFRKDDWTSTLEARVLNMPDARWGQKMNELRSGGYEGLATQLQGMRDGAAQIRGELQGVETELTDLTAAREQLPETLKSAKGVLTLLDTVEEMREGLQDAQGDLSYWQAELASDTADLSAKISKLEGKVSDTQAQLTEVRGEIAAKAESSGMSVEQATDLYNGGYGQLTTYQSNLTDAQQALRDVERQRDNVADGFKDGLSTDQKAELTSLLGLEDGFDWFQKDDWTSILEARISDMPDARWEQKMTELREGGYGDMADSLVGMRQSFAELGTQVEAAQAKVTQAETELAEYPARFDTAGELVRLDGRESRYESRLAARQERLAEAQGAVEE